MMIHKIIRKIGYIVQLIISNLFNLYLNIFHNHFKPKPYNWTINASAKENLAAWESNEQELQKNIGTSHINNFLRWNVIQNTMFLNNQQICKKEFNFLKQSSRWDLIWRKKLTDPSFGNPLRSFYRVKTSCNSIHHAYHIDRYFRFIERNLINDINYIVEFGGGYGNMCRIFTTIGYTKPYIIFDLPIFSSLQQYYLSNTLSNHNYQCISDVDIFSKTLSDIPLRETLFIATWSLSESPLELRQKIINSLTNCKHFLIAYQRSFSEIDNQKYFSKIFQNSFTDVNWITDEIKHIPNNYYLFGKPQR